MKQKDCRKESEHGGRKQDYLYKIWGTAVCNKATWRPHLSASPRSRSYETLASQSLTAGIAHRLLAVCHGVQRAPGSDGGCVHDVRGGECNVQENCRNYLGLSAVNTHCLQLPPLTTN